MKLTRLTAENFRILPRDPFLFHPAFTLVVGVNGAGKSSLLDVLRTCASRILPHISPSRDSRLSFYDRDITDQQHFVDVDLAFMLGRKDFNYNWLQWRGSYVPDDPQNVDRLRSEIRSLDRPRERLRLLLRKLESSQGVHNRDRFEPSDEVLNRVAAARGGAPNCIFFSTSRSAVSDDNSNKTDAGGGEVAAYAEALRSRPLHRKRHAQWIRVQEVLSAERPLARRHLKTMREAVSGFLPGYKNLRSGDDKEPTLLLDKGKTTIDVEQLSDGERGMLSLVLDLARRLSQANPLSRNPLRDGEAIVLIDELDLHLHPKWQRTVVGQLTRAFPRCQFIATTHSPQIVASVQPEQVLLLRDGRAIQADRTLGLDSNWILRALMETDERPKDSSKRVRQVETCINQHFFKKARALMDAARKKGYDLPEWSVFDARIARLEAMNR